MWGVLMRGLIDVNIQGACEWFISFLVMIMGHYICLSIGLMVGVWMGHEMSKAPEVPDYE